MNQRRQERFARWLHLQLNPEAEEEEAVAADVAAAEQEGMEEEKAADAQPDAPTIVNGAAPTAGAGLQEGAEVVVGDDVAMQED